MNDVPPNTLSAPSRSSQASVPGRGRGPMPPAPGMIRFSCGTCGEKLSVPERYAGRKGACPNCGSVNRVPGGPDSGLIKPVFIELPQPAPERAPAPSTSPATELQPDPRSAEHPSPHTPFADNATGPVPARNPGAEL